MVFSVKANKNKIIALIVLLAVIIIAAITIPKIFDGNHEEKVYSGENFAVRSEFLSSFGWQISEEPITEREVTIPEEFTEVYTKYNNMQIAQGFDLAPYKGMICTQYIYLVENYPSDNAEIHATMLVYDGKIIGGDISCAEMNGFMHGFAKDSASYDE